MCKSSLNDSLKSEVSAYLSINFAFPKNNNKLRFIPLTSPKIIRHIGLVQLTNKSLSPAAEALANFILINTAKDKDVEAE